MIKKYLKKIAYKILKDDIHILYVNTFISNFEISQSRHSFESMKRRIELKSLHKIHNKMVEDGLLNIIWTENKRLDAKECLIRAFIIKK